MKWIVSTVESYYEHGMLMKTTGSHVVEAESEEAARKGFRKFPGEKVVGVSLQKEIVKKKK
jgi:hypothetical protein